MYFVKLFLPPEKVSFAHFGGREQNQGRSHSLALDAAKNKCRDDSIRRRPEPGPFESWMTTAEAEAGVSENRVYVHEQLQKDTADRNEY